MKKVCLLLSIGGLTAASLLGASTGIIKNVFNQNVKLNYISCWDRLAVSLSNMTPNDMKYYYLDWNQAGLSSRWYLHYVKSQTSTWDWSWVNATVSHLMEIEVPFHDANKSLYVVLSFKSVNVNIPIMENWIYFRVGDPNTLHSFTEKKWQELIINTNNYDLMNFHGKLDFFEYLSGTNYKLSISWCDSVINTIDENLFK